ncbi:flippase [Candidatus Woesearchaeota archaeon]|nr:flippase [Candidatus Woesearchaeota archaeon]
MNTARRITTNFLSLAASEILSKIIQLIIFVYLARALGNEDFGIFSFGIAFALLIVIIADFGLSTFIIREISRNKKAASKYLSNSVVLKMFLSAITLVAACLFLSIMDYSGEVKIVSYTMLLFAIIQSFTDLYYSIFRAFEKMHYDALIKVLRMAILGGMVFYAIKAGYGVIAASLAFPLTEIIVFIITILLVYSRFIKISFEFDYGFSKKLLKKSSLFCLSLVFSGLFMYISSIMLSKIRSTTDVGIYSAAANIMLALIFIPVMYGNAIYPVISRWYITSKKSLKFAYEKSFKYMLIIGLPLSAGIYVLSDKIILLLYGKEYITSAVVLSILSGYLCLRFLNVVSGFTLSSINRQGSRVFSQGTAALTNVALNFALIPFFGFIGAAIATIITEIVFFFVYTSFIVKYGLGIRFIRLSVRPVIAVSIMIFSLQYIENMFAAIVSGALIYSIALFILGTIDKEDRLLIDKVVKNL